MLASIAFTDPHVRVLQSHLHLPHPHLAIDTDAHAHLHLHLLCARVSLHICASLSLCLSLCLSRCRWLGPMGMRAGDRRRLPTACKAWSRACPMRTCLLLPTPPSPWASGSAATGVCRQLIPLPPSSSARLGTHVPNVPMCAVHATKEGCRRVFPRTLITLGRSSHFLTHSLPGLSHTLTHSLSVSSLSLSLSLSLCLYCAYGRVQ
jgi:hypothetical protein